MSSPLATPNGELEPFPSLEAAAAPPPATTAAGESASSRVVVDEARRRCEDRCTADADLRESLGKLIELCETLTSRVQTLEPQIVDLQTSLTLTQSNLTLSLANTEMLEDALRSNAQSRDVGWRRSDSTSRRPVAASMSYPSAAEHAKIVVSAPTPATPQSPATTPTSPPMPSEGRFFKFRFGAKTPSPTSPAYSQQQTQPGHLTSASLPSLGLSIEDEARAKQLEELASKQESLKLKASEIDARHQELIELEKNIKAREEEVETLLKEREAELEKVRQELQKEKETCRELEQDKARVQDEIETLTQSLFEEANNMVAVERRRMAEVEALLRETEEERDAVRGAMRVVEGENGRLRELSAQGRSSGESTRPSPADEPAPSPVTPPRPGSSHSSHEGDRSILTDKEADPALSSGVGSINISTDVLPPDLPLLPEGTPDPWKAQTPSGASPKTPPRIHALPTETSPWAESRASS